MSQHKTDWRSEAEALGISIAQRSKTVWVACGEHKGGKVELRARSPNMALATWKFYMQRRPRYR